MNRRFGYNGGQLLRRKMQNFGKKYAHDSINKVLESCEGKIPVSWLHPTVSEDINCRMCNNGCDNI